MSRTQRSLGLLSLFALATNVACIGDEIAPQCFYPDGMGGCLTPPIVDVVLNCEDIPLGAVAANFSYTADVLGGSGSCDDMGVCTGYTWTAEGLPAGLMISSSTGQIEGVPTEQGTFAVTVTATDNQFDGTVGTAMCSLEINEELNVEPLRNTAKHCLDVGENIEDFLEGGDGTPYTCSFQEENIGQPSCPHGNGDGVLPAGINTDYGEGTCSHSGTVQEDAFGTWVWVVDMEQSGNTIHVPFCATQDQPGQHDLTVNYSAASTDDGLEPALLEFTPNPPDFGGNGDPNFLALGGDLCNNGGCNFFGFAFAVTCSPLDPPFSLEPGQKEQDMMGNDIGFSHEMAAAFPAPTEEFQDRVWAANWTISYCNSDSAGPCTGDNISANAQTTLNYSVVGWPAN
jgi:hypothetical protein